MKGIDPIAWAREKIQSIRKHSDMHIVLRPHPGKIADVSILANSNVTISNSITRSLTQDISQAAGAFVFNSSSGVAAILYGVPLWVDDPGSLCWEVANKDISRINSPELHDRTQWLNDLSACHWTDEESRQGLIYKKFLPYLV